MSEFQSITPNGVRTFYVQGILAEAADDILAAAESMRERKSTLLCKYRSSAWVAAIVCDDAYSDRASSNERPRESGKA